MVGDEGIRGMREWYRKKVTVRTQVEVGSSCGLSRRKVEALAVRLELISRSISLYTVL